MKQLKFPRLLFYAGRTKEALENIFVRIKDEYSKNSFLHQFIAVQADIPSKYAPFLGWIKIKKNNNKEIQQQKRHQHGNKIHLMSKK